MADKKKEQSDVRDIPTLDITAEQLETMTAEELDLAIKRVELQTKYHTLRREVAANKDHEEKERRRHEANKKRQAELEQGRRNHQSVTQACRHRAGGTPDNILEGGRKNSFSVLYLLRLPDGVSYIVFCPRCRLKHYPPQPSLEQADPKQYAAEKAEHEKLVKECKEEGLQYALSAGATFMFQKKGVPFVPDRV